MAELECDYLVVGTGAVGMAFVDTLLDQSDATVIMVDNHHQPGGHWNDAYPFVRLHQPSHFYGVASTPLGTKRIDQTGSNAGYYELASGTEVQSYFEQVMHNRFLPSGRVQYFPMSEYTGNATFRGVLSGKEQQVCVHKRVVDGTYFNTSVPSRHQKNYRVDNVTCIAPNTLPVRAPDHSNYCIIGAGKTAMDVGVWLLDNGVAPDHIRWVCPRQSWLINRAVTQGSVEFFQQSIGGFANQMQAIAEAASASDAFERLEASGFMLRIDVAQQPEMFHFATISIGEVEQLRRIRQVLQQGRVASIDSHGLHMVNGADIAMPANTLYIDCSASAVDFKATNQRPVFADKRITIQGVRVPNPCLSAAITAYVEANYDNDDTRNRLCQVVPLPDDKHSWLHTTLGNFMNQATWSAEPALAEFVTNCRLDGFGAVIRDADLTDAANVEILEKMARYAEAAVTNLHKLINTS